jgi:hypothetical protein
MRCFVGASHVSLVPSMIDFTHEEYIAVVDGGGVLLLFSPRGVTESSHSLFDIF